MTIGLILVSKNGKYLSNDGSLPVRPDWDKSFITDMIRNKIVLCSENTLKTIPPSMKKAASRWTTNMEEPYDINFGINTFKQTPDLLIMTVSKEEIKEGPDFRTDSFKEILDLGEIKFFTAK